MDHRLDTDIARRIERSCALMTALSSSSVLVAVNIVLKMSGQRVLAVTLAERDEHVLVSHAHVYDRIIAAVVDEDAATVAAHGSAGKHDLRHMGVSGILDAAVSPGREQDGDARHRDQRRVRQVVQRHTERVWVAVHRGAHPVEHAEPAFGGSEGRRTRADLVREGARAAAGPHDRLRLKLPPIRLDRARPAELDLRVDAPDLAARGVIGSEQTRVASANGLGKNHHIAHVSLEHRAMAHEVGKIAGRGQRDAHAVLHRRVIGTVGDIVGVADLGDPRILDAARLVLDEGLGIGARGEGVPLGGRRHGRSGLDTPAVDAVAAAGDPEYAHAATKMRPEQHDRVATVQRDAGVVDGRDLEPRILPHLVHVFGRKHGVIREPRYRMVQIDDHPAVLVHHFLADHWPSSLYDLRRIAVTRAQQSWSQFRCTR